MKMPDRRKGESKDHDLLLTMKAEFGTKLDRVISDVQELKDNVASRVTSLEEEKASKEEFEKFKDSLDPIISNYWKAVGIISFILAALTIWLAYLQTKGH